MVLYWSEWYCIEAKYADRYHDEVLLSDLIMTPKVILEGIELQGSLWWHNMVKICAVQTRMESTCRSILDAFQMRSIKLDIPETSMYRKNVSLSKFDHHPKKSSVNPTSYTGVWVIGSHTFFLADRLKINVHTKVVCVQMFDIYK